MTKIKFGTDGWRAIIAKEFTVENVARVTLGCAAWLKQNFENPSVVVGHDCRFAGELFAETVSKILAQNGIKVKLAKGYVSTPMVSMGALKLNCSLGVVLTASHNPPSYNGYKLKGGYGGPLLPEKIQEVEDLIPAVANFDFDASNLNDYVKSGLIEYVDLETMYVDQVEKSFDMDSIRNSKMEFAYDAMYGSGQNAVRRLLPDITFLHADYNPGFNGIAPEPIDKNLREFAEMIELAEGEINLGLATDGDADRIGLYNSKGVFVDSHHIILLLIKYLAEVKGYKGKVINAFSVTPRVKKMCAHYNLEYQVTQIGFKYIAGYMITEDVLLGGEESGGIAVKGHIPERDGIWMGLIIMEYMAKTGKTLEQLIDDVYAIVGSFWFERYDLHITEELKQAVLKNCKENKYSSFGSYIVRNIETIDGFKFFFDNEEWVMIRASGTEPLLRVYGESNNKENVIKMLDTVKGILLG